MDNWFLHQNEHHDPHHASMISRGTSNLKTETSVHFKHGKARCEKFIIYPLIEMHKLISEAKPQSWPFNITIDSTVIPLAISWTLVICVADALGSTRTWVHTLIWWLTARLTSYGESLSLFRFTCMLLVVLLAQKWKTKEGNVTNLDTLRNKSKAADRATGQCSAILEPLLFPSHTTHRRLFPKQHGFGYSYLLAGVPVYDHDFDINGLLSSHGGNKRIPQAWFSVHSSDYLQRGSSFTHLSLRDKLDIFLEDERVSSDAFPYAYLVTAPRFLGWSFNPVSFWYLYNSEKVLSAMVLEVNNTFDERRIYLLQATSSDSGSQAKKFTAKWKKDFHVSPFNDRTGAYSVSAVDIAATRTVDVTIVLNDVNDKPKIVARIFSNERSPSGEEGLVVGPGINPGNMPRIAYYTFLMQHGWKGFFTNPRILRQAWTLWRKNLTVFFRPEPLLTSVGRTETKEETVIEHSLRNVLRLLAQVSGQDIDYTPAAGQDRGRIVHFAGDDALTEGKYGYCKAKSLCVKILSPQFYTELAIANSSLSAVFERFCFGGCESQILVTSSDNQALRRLLSMNHGCRFEEQTYKVSPAARQQRAVVFLRAVNQAEFVQSFKTLVELFIFQKVANFPTSELDKVTWDAVQGNSVSESEGEAYVDALVAILCANQFAFGSLTLLAIQQSLCRAIVTTFLTGVFMKLLSKSWTNR